MTAIKRPSGKSISTDCKLFPDAPFSDNRLEFLFLRIFGISISFLPEIYFPVRDDLDLCSWAGGPAKVTSPPYLPAPGPRSMT